MSDYLAQAHSFVSDSVSKVLNSTTVSSTVQKFKDLSTWKQVAVSGGIIVGGTISYLVTSYHICNAVYGTIPQRIDYDIWGDIENNKGLIIAIHGWPDTGEMWHNQINYFVSKGYCFVCLELPNFNITRGIQNPWGYSMNTIINSLGETIFNILKEYNRLNNENNYFLGHDWGSIIIQNIYINFKNQFQISKMILLDVGDGGGDTEDDKKENENKGGAYQLVNALCFLMPRNIGTPIAKFYLEKMAYTKSFSKLGGMPIFIKEKKYNKKYFDSIAMYLYFDLMKLVLTNNKKELNKILYVMDGRINELDNISIYMIAGKKGCMYNEESGKFYSLKWEKYIKSRKENKFEIWNCYHWIACDLVGLPNKLNTSMLEFIEN